MDKLTITLFFIFKNNSWKSLSFKFLFKSSRFLRSNKNRYCFVNTSKDFMFKFKNISQYQKSFFLSAFIFAILFLNSFIANFYDDSFGLKSLNWQMLPT